MSKPVSLPRRRLLIAGAGSAVLSACATRRASAPGAPPIPIVFVHGNGDSAALGTTGAARVALVGNSRGGYAIRNYLANGAGAPFVSHVVLGGTPNHGVWANPGFRPGSEFNGAGAFLRGLNTPRNPQGDEVVAGVNWLTLRSDNNDKIAQPDGVWIGAPGTPTGVTAEGPALKGARNEVLPGRDHREVSFHPQAFAATHVFLTGRSPASTAIAPEAQVVLNGRVCGLTSAGASNLPLPGATVEVHAVDPLTGERRGAALHRQQVGSVVTMTCPRGYFGVPRDQIMLDGVSPPAGIPRGAAGVSQARVKLKRDAIGRAVAGEFNGERLVGRAWPVSEGRVVVLELHS